MGCLLSTFCAHCQRSVCFTLLLLTHTLCAYYQHLAGVWKCSLVLLPPMLQPHSLDSGATVVIRPVLQSISPMNRWEMLSLLPPIYSLRMMTQREGESRSLIHLGADSCAFGRRHHMSQTLRPPQ